jgi:hypothetical protein
LIIDLVIQDFAQLQIVQRNDTIRSANKRRYASPELFHKAAKTDLMVTLSAWTTPTFHSLFNFLAVVRVI